MSVARELRKVLRGEVEDAPALLERYSRDASLFKVRPEAVIYPRDTEDICSVVRFVSQKKKQDPKSNVSLTTRAAGTDMSGGPLGDSIIVDTLRHLNRLRMLVCGTPEKKDECFAVVESGMFFRDFDAETKKENLELPSYTASREINTVGGMVANDSGGEKNLKYGKTARYVEELEVVMADGAAHDLKKWEGDELRGILTQQTYLGDIARRVANLVSAHKDTITKARPVVEKNSSGYALWDIGDGKNSLNLGRLMVGAQGTLGIITKIKFSLVRPKPYASMAILFLDSIAELGELVPLVLSRKPDSFESYDDHTFHLAVKYFPEFAKRMRMGIFSLGISFLPELWMAITGGVPKLVLLVEFRADTQAEAFTRAKELAEEVHKKNPQISTRIAKDEQAAKKYWIVRHESFNLLRNKVRGLRTAPFIDDFVVPPASLPQFLPRLEKILSKYDLIYTITGHVGDGNFHIIPLVDPRRSGIEKIIDELSHKVYDLVLSYHGSITGEHNDGLIRTPYVEKMFGAPMHALFLEIKKIFDPQNIFNPGKKVGTNFSDAITKLDLPKQDF